MDDQTSGVSGGEAAAARILAGNRTESRAYRADTKLHFYIPNITQTKKDVDNVPGTLAGSVFSGRIGVRAVSGVLEDPALRAIARRCGYQRRALDGGVSVYLVARRVDLFVRKCGSRCSGFGTRGGLTAYTERCDLPRSRRPSPKSVRRLTRASDGHERPGRPTAATGGAGRASEDRVGSSEEPCLGFWRVSMREKLRTDGVGRLV